MTLFDDVLAGTRGVMSTTGVVVDADPERDRLAVPAPNVIEWIVEPQWLNLPETYQYTRQYQIIRDLFQLRCPVCNPGGAIMSQEMSEGHPGNCWGKSRMELEGEALLVWSDDLGEDVCPKCAGTRSEFIRDDLMTVFDCLHAVVGMRAGKSVMAGIITTYVEHRVVTLALSTPGGIQGYLGMPSAEQLEMTLLASTDVQSQDTIWAKYRNYRELSPWFKQYIPWVKKQEKAQVTPPGMQPWKYDESDKKIRNGLHKLLINSLNSNSGGLVGKTRLLSGADEVGRMKQTDSSQGANEIYRGLENSLRTVRSRSKKDGGKGVPWLGMMLSVTSPISYEDKSMQLLEVGQSRRVKGMYACHYATWDFNPTEPRENFDDDFAKDPVGAERDFGARPPKAAHPLIHNEERFLASAIDEAGRPRAVLSTVSFEDETGQSYVAPRLESCDLVTDSIPRYIACDAGKNFDAFAISCSHGEERDGSWVTVFDFVYRIVPPKGSEVHFDSFYDLLAQLRQKLPIVQVEFDRWNSIHLIQKIRQLGVRAEQVSTKTQDFLNFAQDVLLGRVALLPPTTADKTAEPPLMSGPGVAVYELSRLERDPISDKVFNPRKGERRGYNSDDTAQTIVHCHKMIQSQGYTAKAEDRTKAARRARAEADSMQYRGTIQRTPAGIMGGARIGGGRGW